MARYIKNPKGDFRVQYWGPEEFKGSKNGVDKWSKTHNTYYFDEEMAARAKYAELLVRQALGTMHLERVVFEVLFDFGGDDKLAFVKTMESTRR